MNMFEKDNRALIASLVSVQPCNQSLLAVFRSLRRSNTLASVSQ